MNRILLATLLINFQFLAGQETETPIILQPHQTISNIEFKRILDSISLVRLHPNFFENSIFKENDAINVNDTLKTETDEQRRMRLLFGSYSDFQRKFLALDLKNDVPDLHLPKVARYNTQYGDPNYAGTVGCSFTGPVTLLYNAFSKEEKSRRRYYALKEFEPSRKIINAKYNYQKVKNWTKLDDDNLTRFVLFCHFDDDYLLNVNEYDLIEEVMIKLIEYKAIEDSSNYKQ
jgi:hypothetical protein